MDRKWGKHVNARYLDWIIHDQLEYPEWWGPTRWFNNDYNDADQLAFAALPSVTSGASCSNEHSSVDQWLSFRSHVYDSAATSISPMLAVHVGLVLIAWPHSANLFQVGLDQVQFLAQLGDPAAQVIQWAIPAVYRFHEYPQWLHS
jgi:hypothetical protein